MASKACVELRSLDDFLSLPSCPRMWFLWLVQISSSPGTFVGMEEIHWSCCSPLSGFQEIELPECVSLVLLLQSPVPGLQQISVQVSVAEVLDCTTAATVVPLQNIVRSRSDQQSPSAGRWADLAQRRGLDEISNRFCW